MPTDSSESLCKGVSQLREAIGKIPIEDILDICATTPECGSACRSGQQKNDIIKKMTQSIAAGETKVRLSELEEWSGMDFLSNMERMSGVSIIQEGQNYVACAPPTGLNSRGLRDYIFRRRPSLATYFTDIQWNSLLTFLQTNLSESQCSIIRSASTSPLQRKEIRQPVKEVDTKSLVDNPAYYTFIAVYGPWVRTTVSERDEDYIRSRALVDIDNIFGSLFLQSLDEIKVDRRIGISIAFDEFLINENMTLRLLYRVKNWFRKNRSNVSIPKNEDYTMGRSSPETKMDYSSTAYSPFIKSNGSVKGAIDYEVLTEMDAPLPSQGPSQGQTLRYREREQIASVPEYSVDISVTDAIYALNQYLLGRKTSPKRSPMESKREEASIEKLRRLVSLCTSGSVTLKKTSDKSLELMTKETSSSSFEDFTDAVVVLDTNYHYLGSIFARKRYEVCSCEKIRTSIYNVVALDCNKGIRGMGKTIMGAGREWCIRSGSISVSLNSWPGEQMDIIKESLGIGGDKLATTTSIPELPTDISYYQI